MMKKMFESAKNVLGGSAAVGASLLLLGATVLWAQQTGGDSSSADEVLAEAIMAPVAPPGAPECAQSFGAARRGLIPVLPVDYSATEIESVAGPSDSRRAFGIIVPANGSITVKVDHQWDEDFYLAMVDREGRVQSGMLGNLIYKGHPEVTYRNPTNAAKAVYIVVYYGDLVRSFDSPYKLLITHN